MDWEDTGTSLPIDTQLPSFVTKSVRKMLTVRDMSLISKDEGKDI
jgi:hypothetical protein